MGCYMITKRQYNVLSFYLTRTLFLGSGFTLLTKLSKNDFLISSIIGMLLGYFLLYCLFKKDTISKIMNIVVAISTLVMGILANTILTSNYLLFNTPTLLIVIIFFLALLYAASKDFKVIGRVCEKFIFISIIEIVLALSNLFGLVDVQRLMPMFNTSSLNILKGIIVFVGASLLPNILLINYKGDLKFKDIQYGYIVACLLMIVVIFFILSIYGSEFASNARFPEFLILKKINVMGYLSNIENVLVTEWMFNILISSWVCIKVLKENLNKGLFVIIIILFILGSEFLLNRNYVNVLYIKQYFYYISFALVILSLVIKKRKN